MLERFHPSDVPPAAGPYSAAIRVGDLLFCAGQGPFNAAGERVGDDFEGQVRQTLDNLERVCAAAGTSLKNAVRVGVFLTSLDYFAEFNRIYAEYVSEPLPARTTVPVALRGFDVEIDAVVAVPRY